MRSSPAPRDRGFTLIEILLASLVFAVLVLGVGRAILSTYGLAGRMEQDEIVFAQAQSYMDSVLAVRFGRADDPEAGSAAIGELLDCDTWAGDISFQGFRKACPVEFDLVGFPVPGRWRIEVTADLNADGDESDLLEGRTDAFRIQILHDGGVVLAAVRVVPSPLDEAAQANALCGPPPDADADVSEDDVLKAAGTTRTHRGFQMLAEGVGE